MPNSYPPEFHWQMVESVRAVFSYVEGFYSPRRRHSANGQLSPTEYERRQALKPIQEDGYSAA